MKITITPVDLPKFIGIFQNKHVSYEAWKQRTIAFFILVPIFFYFTSFESKSIAKSILPFNIFIMFSLKTKRHEQVKSLNNH